VFIVGCQSFLIVVPAFRLLFSNIKHSLTGYVVGVYVGGLVGLSVGDTDGGIDGSFVAFGTMNSLGSVGAKLLRSRSGETVGGTVGANDGMLVGAKVGVAVAGRAVPDFAGLRELQDQVVIPFLGASAAPPASNDLRAS
jgi:hypothetical protein